MLKTTTILLLTFCLGVFTTGYSQSSASTVDDKSLLIQFVPSNSVQQIAQAMQDLNSTIIWSNPSTNVYYTEVNYFPYTNPQGAVISDINTQLEAAQNRGDVDDVNHDYIIKVQPGSGGIPPGILCHEEITNPNPVTTDVKITIMDTGLSNLFTTFTPISSWNYVSNTPNVKDDHGHGTHMASVISESFEENSGYAANQLKWDIRKTHNALGEAHLANIIRALYDAVAVQTNIVNMSFSYYNYVSSVDHSIFQKAILDAEQEDILIVTSAGNEDHNNDNQSGTAAYPCAFSDPNILSVGSFDCVTNQLSSFSNYGIYSVDIAAPGVGIEGEHWLTGNPYYLTGTSQATAITSGVAAALAVHLTTFNYKPIKCAIISGVTIKNSLANKVLTSGLLNADDALFELLNNCEIPVVPVRKVRPVADLYPNPTLGELFLNLEQLTGVGELTILDVNGRVILTKRVTESKTTQVNVMNLAPGMYTLRLTDQNGSSNQAFIKQ